MPMNRKIGTISKKFPRPYEGIFNTGTPGPITRSVSGQNLITLNNAIANELLEVKAFGGTFQGLPPEYEAVQFVSILNQSYLLTDIVPKYNGRYEIDIETTTLSTSLATTYMGVRPASTGNGGLRFARISSQVFRVYGFGSYSDSSIVAKGNTRYKFTWNNQNAKIVSGDTVIYENTFADTGSCSYPICINGRNSAGTITPGSEGIFVYSFKAWDEQGNLIANYIPCVLKEDPLTVGFYDTVQKKFMTATSGTFSAGPTQGAEIIPTPDAPIEITSNNGILKVSGNILDMSIENIVLGKYIDNSGIIQDSPQNFYNSKYIPVAHDEIYTRSTTRNVRYISIMEYDINKTFIKRTLFNNGTDGKNSGSLTIGSTTAFVLFGSNPLYANITMDDIFSIHRQFEKNSVGTAQPEYGIYADGTQETIEDSVGNSGLVENLLSIASIKDEQELLTGNIVRHVGIKILDGSENRTKVSSPLGNIYQADLLDQNMFSHLICTHFENDAPLNNNTIHKSAGSSIVEIRYDTASTVQDFVQFLISQYTSGNPVLVVYGLQSPTTETVTGQTLDIQTGTNTIEITQASIDPLTLSAKYKATA